jgi:uncharacterized protein YheU (UPF0270 family)
VNEFDSVNDDAGDDWYRSPQDSDADKEQQGLLIPADSLSADALTGLIDEFVTRDGTDYGASEVSLDARIEQVRRQLAKGDVSVVFDLATQTANLVLTRELSRMNVINPDVINQAAEHD